MKWQTETKTGRNKARKYIYPVKIVRTEEWIQELGPTTDG